MTVSKLVTIGAVAGLALTSAAAMAQQAQQQLSDKAVQAYMDYAWSIMPQKFTRPDGKVIVIDKAARDKVEVPVGTARDAVMAGRRSAYAQACTLPREQIANYRSLMVREEETKKWSDQQLMFINQIHLTTVMLLNGTIELVEDNGGGRKVVVDPQASVRSKLGQPSGEVCKDILGQISAYVAAGPKIPTSGLVDEAPATAAAPSAPATTGATPTPAKSTPTAASPPKKN
jgi:hypothetical protein